MAGPPTLKKRREFVAVFDKGKTWRDDAFVMRALANRLDTTRFGYTISKEVGGAVTRNRLRRQLKEIARRLPVKPGWDVVLIVRSRTPRAGYQEMRERLERLFRRAGLIKENETGGPGLN